MTARTIRFGLVLSEREYQALLWLAQDEGGLSKAAVLRRLLRREAKERGFLPPVSGGLEPLRNQKEVSNA